MFARGGDDALWQRTYTLFGGWGPWESREGYLTSAPSADATPGRFRLQVVANGGDGKVSRRDFNLEAGWQAWRQLLVGGRPLQSAEGTRPFVLDDSYSWARPGLTLMFDESYPFEAACP